MNVEYNNMKSQVVSAQSSTLAAVGEAASLLEKHDEVATKQEVLSKFKEHFIMTEEEIVAMTSTAEPVDDRFFKALSKAKTIMKDCELLLGLENQRLGLDLMEKTSQDLNFGFQKLYKWIQREFKSLNLENPQMGYRIRQALRILAERPTLFRNCLNFLSEARERLLSEAFHMALTGAVTSGTENPFVKPIDLTAHDVLRYAGDMMAWVHSTAVSEREALEILFIAKGEEVIQGLEAGTRNEVWHLIADDDKEPDFNAVRILSDLVDQNLSGVAKLLRQRTEQVIQTNEDVVPAYKLATLLNFYRLTFEKLLGPSSNLQKCVQSLEREALHQFRSLMKDNIASAQGDFSATTKDLAAPAFLTNALEQLSSIMLTYDTSLSSADSQESDFENVMVDGFDPFLSGCENMAKHFNSLAASIFIINCNLAAKQCLAAFSFTKSRTDKIQSTIEYEAAQLVEKQSDFFRRESGLAPDLLGKTENGTTTICSDVKYEVLLRVSQQLDEFLPSALLDAKDRVKHIRDADLASRITEEAAEIFCRDFEKLEQEIHRKDLAAEVTEEPSWRAIFPRTSAEIRVLLS